MYQIDIYEVSYKKSEEFIVITQCEQRLNLGREDERVALCQLMSRQLSQVMFMYPSGSVIEIALRQCVKSTRS